MPAMTQASKNRVRYPNRTVFFGIEAGLVDPKEQAAKVEANRVERFTNYLLNGCLVVESLEDFKKRFGL